jgi:hypothetical protein
MVLLLFWFYSGFRGSFRDREHPFGRQLDRDPAAAEVDHGDDGGG